MAMDCPRQQKSPLEYVASTGDFIARVIPGTPGSFHWIEFIDNILVEVPPAQLLMDHWEMFDEMPVHLPDE